MFCMVQCKPRNIHSHLVFPEKKKTELKISYYFPESMFQIDMT